MCVVWVLLPPSKEINRKRGKITLSWYLQIGNPVFWKEGRQPGHLHGITTTRCSTRRGHAARLCRQVPLIAPRSSGVTIQPRGSCGAEPRVFRQVPVLGTCSCSARADSLFIPPCHVSSCTSPSACCSYRISRIGKRGGDRVTICFVPVACDNAGVWAAITDLCPEQ
jgi:hypothetical protein